ncbi:MAG: PIG-L deacetylase family protein [Acidimicrobiales bacterium]
MAELIEEVPARVLAVYAHPDDHEMSCGGTLARWAAAGAEVHVVIATRGEKGSSDPTTDMDALADLRAKETRAAGAVLGVSGFEMLGEPDGELDNSPDLRRRLVTVVRRVRPDIVICPDPTAVFFGETYVNHIDHREIGWATLDAVAPASSSPLYFPEAGAAHQVATVLLTGVLEPSVWVDIGGALQAKIDALFCHGSQLGSDAGEWLEHFVRQRAEDEGRRAGVASAEGFRRIRLQGT